MLPPVSLDLMAQTTKMHHIHWTVCLNSSLVFCRPTSCVLLYLNKNKSLHFSICNLQNAVKTEDTFTAIREVTIQNSNTCLLSPTCKLDRFNRCRVGSSRGHFERSNNFHRFRIKHQHLGRQVPRNG